MISSFSDLRLTLLQFIRDNGAPNLAEIHQALGGNPSDLRSILINMASEGWITKDHSGAFRCSLTNLGREQLLVLEERVKKAREEDAKKEAQQRFQNKISVTTALIPFVTFILGLITEHYTSVISFLSRIAEHWR